MTALWIIPTISPSALAGRQRGVPSPEVASRLGDSSSDPSPGRLAGCAVSTGLTHEPASSSSEATREARASIDRSPRASWVKMLGGTGEVGEGVEDWAGEGPAVADTLPD